MANHSRLGSAIAATGLLTVVTLTALPLLAVGTSGGPEGCPLTEEPNDGTPTILGPAAITVAQLTAWWESTGRTQPARLTAPIADVIALYGTEGALHGVRADLALAQAILETGWFSNSDTGRNNYAGIGHYDHADAGFTFPDAATGVRAHVQLLHKFALGNDAPLARPDVAPRAGAQATTWGGLAGTWATDPGYWPAVAGVYQRMLDHATDGNHPALLVAPGPIQCAADRSAEVTDGYSLPVDPVWYQQHPTWFSKPHHDYPAADIPVPTGTLLYATTAGTIASL
ncbi:MAG TPA: glucosaminidase domain-containing protein, partial [Acidimicrobiales bacterium]|nr:glucosaminidase domain-containing protein [Acidimicrobiales bacterium]